MEYANPLENIKFNFLFKSGIKSNPSNYRPISIHPSLLKKYENIISNQINSFDFQNKLLSYYQFGFKKLYNANFAILTISWLT